MSYLPPATTPIHHNQSLCNCHLFSMSIAKHAFSVMSRFHFCQVRQFLLGYGCACAPVSFAFCLPWFIVYYYSSIGTTTRSWVSACSTIVQHSQQDGVTECRCQRHVKPSTWRRTRDLERSNFRHKRLPASEAMLANPAAEGGTMGEKWPRILLKVATSTSLLDSFPCCKAWHGTDGFTSPPKEGVLRIFSPEKSDSFAWFEPANLGTKGQHATSRPPKPLIVY
jgi:hypothetical protein